MEAGWVAQPVRLGHTPAARLSPEESMHPRVIRELRMESRGQDPCFSHQNWPVIHTEKHLDVGPEVLESGRSDKNTAHAR